MKKNTIAISLVAAVSLSLLYSNSLISKRQTTIRKAESTLIKNNSASQIERQKAEDRFNRIIKEAENEKILKDKQALMTFKTALRSITRSFDPQTKKVIGELTSFKSCFLLSFKMAKDKYSDSQDAVKMLNEATAPLQQSAVDTQIEVENALKVFQQQLEANLFAMKEKVLNGMTSLKTDVNIPSDLQKTFHKRISFMQASIENIADKTTKNTIGLGLDAAFFYVFSRTAAQNVLGAIVTKIGPRAAAFAVPAIADGPFLIGDAITIVLEGGLAMYTAYEIWDAQDTMKSKMTSKINEGVEAFRNDLHSEAMLAATDIYELYQFQLMNTQAQQ